jgi:UDP-glucose 4-epimerase
LTDDPYELIRKLRLSSKGDEFYSLIHMAAWKDLPGSYNNPLEYYRNNLFSTVNAAEIAGSLGCKSIIFSSSAAVYSDELSGCITESDKVTGDSPYGYTKLVGERIIQDIANQFGMRSYSLRYQNPIGCIEGVTVDTSDSMFGNILNSIKYDKEFIIFGGDYPTRDGTCIRDYISIQDIAKAHIYFMTSEITPGIYNVGTGKGTSCLNVCKIVKDLYPEFRYKIGDRRPGDAAGSFADTTKLQSTGFRCDYIIYKVIKDIIKQATGYDRLK